MAKVYVASSWSNEYQPRIVAFLRERGHEVYDFRNPERKTDFCWSQISGNWEKISVRQRWPWAGCCSPAELQHIPRQDG